MVIKVKLLSDTARLPEHSGGTQHDNVGLDFFASENALWVPLKSGVHKAIVHTGVALEMPVGYHLRLAGRSGMAVKKDIIPFPGTIDSSYRGEILLMFYAMDKIHAINVGDKVIQGVVFKSVDYSLEEVSTLSTTLRNDKGFGSTDATI